MKAEDYILFIEQGRRDKVSPEGLRLIAIEYRELLQQRDELLEKIKKLEFMIDKGLGWDDMKYNH